MLQKALRGPLHQQAQAVADPVAVAVVLAAAVEGDAGKDAPHSAKYRILKGTLPK